MKNKISEALKTKYKNLGFGEKAFDGVAEYLSKTVTEETAIDNAITGVEPLLKAFQGDIDKVRTEKSNTEKMLAELNAKIKQLGGEPDKKTEPKKPELPPDTPEWAKALIENNKKVSEELAQLKAEKTTTNRKQQLNKIIENLPESLQYPYKHAAIDNMDDEQFTQYLSETTKNVEEVVNDMKVKGVVFAAPLHTPGGTSTSNDPKPTAEEIEEVKEKMGVKEIKI